MVYAVVSKTTGCKTLRVRVPPPVLIDSSSGLCYARDMNLKKVDAIKYGWAEVMNNFWVIVGIYTASVALPAIVQNLIKDSEGNPLPLFSLLSFLLSILFTCGLIKLALHVFEKKTISASLLYSEHKYYVQMLLGTILNGIAVGLGMILLIIPGIIIGIKLSMFKYFIIEKNMSSVDALKASWNMTNGYVWELFLFALLRIGVMILGILALGIGVLIAYPVIELAKVNMYHQLKK